MDEIKLDDMVPGEIYYGVQCNIKELDKHVKFFTNSVSAYRYKQQIINDYSHIYGKNCLKHFICTHRAVKRG